MDNIVPAVPGLHLTRRIGIGATSQVYEAYRTSDGEKIALKIVPLNVLPDGSAHIRVRHEISALRSLRHPSIVRLMRSHETKDNIFMELEFIDGSTLTEWMPQNQLLLLEPKLWILTRLAQALAVAHAEGVLHRDLKPDNILISKQGDVKLSDFGLAKQIGIECQETQPGLLVGSLAYMAPELLSDGKSSFASDIFSFGVIAFELLTGRHPFPHNDVKSLLEILYSKERKIKLQSLPAVPQELEELLLQCLSSDPTQRPASLWEIYAELMVALHASGIQDSCRQLISEKATEGNLLAVALEHKQVRLRAEIIAESDKKELDRKKLLRLINEFAVLFPNTSETSRFLALLHEKTSVQLKKSVAIICAMLFLLLTFYGVWKFEGNDSVSAIRSQLREPQLNQSLDFGAEEKKAIEQNLPISQKSLPAPAATGILRLSTAPDVRVSIDGSYYNQAALRHLRLKEGDHVLLLERDGYLPIKKSIHIRRNSVIKIQASEVVVDE